MPRGALQAESHALRAALERFPTRRAWLAAPHGAALLQRLERHLDLVRRFEPEPDPEPERAAAGAAAAVHIVQWNILHGDCYEKVETALRTESQLAGADLIGLEETDLGMARSGNRDVAFELAASLGLHAAWAPLFLELTAGYRAPASLAALPHREALFGIALLSRFPLGAVRRVALTSPEDLLFDRERKAGRFVALVAEVQRPQQPFTMVVVHLDVHGTPAGRLVQMREVLAAVPAGPAVLAGDLNTTTFARGGSRRAAQTLATLALGRKSRLRERLLEPHRSHGHGPREPLFAALAEDGFEVAPFNDPSPTLDIHFDDVHELDRLPPALRGTALGLLRGVERRTAMRLDWIAARGFEPVEALPPFALLHLARGASAASDHAPIGCGVRRVEMQSRGS